MYDNNNIFAKIISGEIPCKEVYQDEKILAFEDVAPAAPTHVLVVPKGEYISFDDFMQNANAEQIAGFFAKTRQIASDLGLVADGYRIVMNHGKNGNQTVPHFHVHILGGKQLGGL